MATSYEVIFLGTLPRIDPTQDNEVAENATAILGTHGSSASPLSSRVGTLTADRLSEDDNSSYDTDNNGGYDSFRINGGAVQNFDAVATYNATIQYADGTTATITATVFQDVNGNTYLAPEETANADQAALTDKPILSLNLTSVVANSGDMLAERVAGDFKASVDGTAGDDSMSVGYADTQGDQITEGNDHIVSGSGNDTVSAGGGNDAINTDTGNDWVYGGSGADVYYGGSGNDRFGDWNTEGGNDTLYGGDGDDTLIGAADSDQIYGDTGNDFLSGGVGADTIYGGTGNDVFFLTEDHQLDTFYGGENVGDSDWIGFGNWQSTNGVAVTFTGSEAGTYDYNGSGDATGSFTGVEAIWGTAYADTVNASASTSAVQMHGNEGADTLTGGADHDLAFGGTGDDHLLGGEGNDTLNGGDGNDTLGGEGGDDLLRGDAGNDGLSGGIGADVLQGGAGNDTLTGGAGNDAVVLEVGGGSDVVTDFDLGDDDSDGWTNDQLDTSGLTGGTGPAGSVRAADVAVQDDGFGNAVLVFPGGERIVLQGVAPNQISSAPQLHAAGIPCFTPGARIDTDQGPVPVERLRPGHRVRTLDHGYQPVRWVGCHRLSVADLAAHPGLRPVVIRRCALGNARPMLVSPQHGFLLGGQLIRAKHLAAVWGGRIARVDQRVQAVTYVHFLCDRHEVVFAEGIATESLYPGTMALRAMGLAALAELLRLFPDLATCLVRREAVKTRYGPPVRSYAKMAGAALRLT